MDLQVTLLGTPPRISKTYQVVTAQEAGSWESSLGYCSWTDPFPPWSLPVCEEAEVQTWSDFPQGPWNGPLFLQSIPFILIVSKLSSWEPHISQLPVHDFWAVSTPPSAPRLATKICLANASRTSTWHQILGWAHHQWEPLSDSLSPMREPIGQWQPNSSWDSQQKAT